MRTETIDYVIKIHRPYDISLNSFYKIEKFNESRKKVAEIKNAIAWELRARLNELSALGEATRFEIDLSHNSKLDVDNAAPLAKMFADALIKRGLIKDDDNTRYTQLTLRMDRDLKANHFRIVAKILYENLE